MTIETLNSKQIIIMKVKNISKLVVAGLLSVPMLTACHDDDNVDLGSLTPESGPKEREHRTPSAQVASASTRVLRTRVQPFSSTR